MEFLFLVKAVFILSYINFLVASKGQCIKPFTNIHDICMYLYGSPTTYCDAWSACYSIGGRLAIGDEIPIIIDSGLLDYNGDKGFYVGVNDLLHERYKSRIGWLFSNGSFMSETAKWKADEPGIGGYEPDGGVNGQDCVVIFSGELYDLTCEYIDRYICVYDREKDYFHERTFVKDDSVLFNNDNQLGCYESRPAKRVTYCAIIALKERVYKSFYYDEGQNNCILVKYIDSTLPKSWDTSNNKWHSYH